MNRKGQVAAPTLMGTVVAGVMALIIAAIVIYAVGFPVLTSLNTSTFNASGCILTGTCSIPYSQQGNMATLFLLLGVMVIIVALTAFLFITRLVG